MKKPLNIVSTCNVPIDASDSILQHIIEIRCPLLILLVPRNNNFYSTHKIFNGYPSSDYVISFISQRVLEIALLCIQYLIISEFYRTSTQIFGLEMLKWK